MKYTSFDYCVQMILPNGKWISFFYEELEEILDGLVVEDGVEQVLGASFSVIPLPPAHELQIVPRNEAAKRLKAP